MLATSASRPAMLSETMRRVRLENASVNRDWPARVSSLSGRRHFRLCRLPAATLSSDAGSSWGFTPGLGCVRSSKSDHCVRWFGADRILSQTGALVPKSQILKARQRGAPRRKMPARRAAVESSFLEAVADTVERLDHLEIVVHHLELLAQPL